MKKYLLILLTLVLLLGGCAPAEHADIAATTLPVWQFTCRLTEGTDLTVTRLVTEEVSCLHDYTLPVRQMKAIEEESGAEASAKELIHLIEEVRHHDIRAIFVETNGSCSAASIIAAETGAHLSTLSMVMSGDDYFAAMYANIDALKEALK